MRWPGFRKVRRQVCKRIARRTGNLGLADLDAYRSHLEAHPEEWRVLDALCRITISRFYRDKGVFDQLAGEVLPALARQAMTRQGAAVRCWCAGCASGEEAYTLSILWKLTVPGSTLRMVATDADGHMVERARKGCYAAGSLRDAPKGWLETAFERSGPTYCVRPPFRAGIEFIQRDIRDDGPDGPFDLVLCRNLAFTYFDDRMQRTVLRHLSENLRPGGFLVIGRLETLPGGGGPEIEELAPCLYRKRTGPPTRRP
jgi:chemotaxis protein methyltransferase CheR